MDFAPFLTFSGTVLTAVVTVLGTIWVARSRAKVDVGASLTNGFKELTDQLQEEREQLGKLIEQQRRDLRQAEEQMRALEQRLRLKRRYIAMLEDKLERAGIDFIAWKD